MSSYYQSHNSSYLSRRGIAFLGIVALHLLFIWALATGLASTGVRYVQTILQTNIIQTEKPKDLPPPPPPVDLKERPPVQVIAPDINISIPVEAPPPIQIVTTQKVEPPPAPRAIVPGTPVRPTYVPDVNSYYPDASRRAGEEGRVLVKVCVNATGKIDSTDVATSSGHPGLDEAALKVARAYRFKPATSDGRPVASCPSLPGKFELHAAG
jgi:periplasmic protein TonB